MRSCASKLQMMVRRDKPVNQEVLSMKISYCLPLALLLSVSTQAQTGGDPVDCKVSTDLVAIYGGNASCQVMVAGRFYTVRQFVHDTNVPSQWISEALVDNGVRGNYSCQASLDKLRDEPRTRRNVNISPLLVLVSRLYTPLFA